jgi:hypothetical protein
MAAVKSLNSNYTITNKATPLANVIVATHTMFVDGNLLVGGNTTQVTKTDLFVSDNLITINKGEVGTGVTLGRAGIEVDRGLAANVQLIYNEAIQKWQITNDGTTYYTIVSSSSTTGLTAVVDDPAPLLGGNLDVLSRTIFSSNVNVVKFDNNLAISTTTVNPAAISNYNIVYAKTPSTGGSGLFVTNTTNSNRELASTKKAIVYSLVL